MQKHFGTFTISEYHTGCDQQLNLWQINVYIKDQKSPARDSIFYLAIFNWVQYPFWKRRTLPQY